MKKISFLILALLGINIASYGQNETKGPSNSNPPSATELPGLVIKSAGKDFSLYLPDKNPDEGIRALESKFIGYNLGKDYEGFDKYLVIMESDRGKLTATYNENGKLINVVEKYTNVRLPNEVIYSIYKAYPGWQIMKDKFEYSQEDGNVTKKEYDLKIKKEKETKHVIVSSKGTILKSF